MGEELSRLVLASMRCGVIAVDAGGRVLIWNRPAGKILGVDPDRAVGRDCREVLAGCPALAHLLVEALDRATLPDRAELELEWPDGRRGLIGFSLSRVEDGAGRATGSAIFFKDLTLVEEERERQALRNRLASLGEMAAQLAHEIRNRLGGIQLFLGLARRRLAKDPDGQAYLSRAEAEIAEANAKIGEILAFVRPVRLELSRVDPVEVCREALEAARARIGSGAARVRWHVDRPVPPAQADRGRLRDALTNLLSNAFEATGPGGTVTVRVAAEEAPTLVAAPVPDPMPGLKEFGALSTRRLLIEIADDGPGMGPEVLRRIFHPFFTTKEEGSGLGIPTAQKILDAHGGSLDVTSAPGRGTTFIVRVPAFPEEGDDG